jgi:hypothetical protein
MTISKKVTKPSSAHPAKRNLSPNYLEFVKRAGSNHQ